MLRFWENKGCINEIDPYGWFQYYFKYWLGRKSGDDFHLLKEKSKNWHKNLSKEEKSKVKEYQLKSYQELIR